MYTYIYLLAHTSMYSYTYIYIYIYMQLGSQKRKYVCYLQSYPGLFVFKNQDKRHTSMPTPGPPEVLVDPFLPLRDLVFKGSSPWRQQKCRCRYRISSGRVGLVGLGHHCDRSRKISLKFWMCFICRKGLGNLLIFPMSLESWNTNRKELLCLANVQHMNPTVSGVIKLTCDFPPLLGNRTSLHIYFRIVPCTFATQKPSPKPSQPANFGGLGHLETLDPYGQS